MRAAGVILCSLLSLAAACGKGGGNADGGDGGGGGGPPFEGRNVDFQSVYASFPSDFGFRLVRDVYAFKPDDACAGIKRYSNQVPLPAPDTRVALYINIEAAMVGDINVVAGDPGTGGDMRFASVAEYAPGMQTPKRDGLALPGTGFVRVTAFTPKQRVAGSYSLQFPSGERLTGDFDVNACP